MNVVLSICCFCEKVRDDVGTEVGEGPWRDMNGYKVRRELLPLDTIFAYGCCPDCLADHPQAIAFRTRKLPASLSLRDKRQYRESLRQF
jgi:hypothetical protein